MANRFVPKNEPKIFLREWIALRTKDDPDAQPDLAKFAARLDIDVTNLYRWLGTVKDKRELDLPTLQFLAEGLDIKLAHLFKHPREAPPDELLSGMRPAQRKEALDYIAYVRSKGA